MAKMVFDEMKAFAKHKGVSGGVEWNSIQETVNTFNSNKPKTYLDIMFQRLTETATFEGYDAKIKKLDATFTMPATYLNSYKDATGRASLRKKLRGNKFIMDRNGGQFIIPLP